MDVTGYAVIGLGGVLLLVLLIAGLLRLRRTGKNDEAAVIREEPTLEASPEQAAEPPAEDAAEAFAEHAAELPSDPQIESRSDPQVEPESDPEPEPEPEADIRPEAAAGNVADAAAAPSAASGPATGSGATGAGDAEPDPAFLAARERLGEELRAGHFSRLDVFEDYRRAAEKAYGHIGPRSEFFSRVVNEAIAVRDEFEGLLDDEDRGRFVEVHSRYLDEVSIEADAAARGRMHQEQVELLSQLRARAGALRAEA